MRTTAEKWEQHEEALQQWRRETAIHKQRYQPVQQTYEEYVQKKKRERAESARGRYVEYVQPGVRGSFSAGGPTGGPPGAPQSQISSPGHFTAGGKSGMDCG